MDDIELQDRHDAPIWHALESGNTKQALKLVDKRLAKKKTEHLEVLKIHIRSRSTVEVEQKAVLGAIKAVVTSKRGLSHLEDLNLHDESFANVATPGDSWASVIGELRWLSIKTSPGNERLALCCFQECLNHGDWEHVQQIASSLDKNFPKERKYALWNITALFARSLRVDPTADKSLIWGKLAHGQISKLAETTKQCQDFKTVPSRALQTSQELLLLLRITAKHGKPGEALLQLNHSMLGPESALARGDWELWRRYIQLMASSEQWQELYELTQGLLKRARTKDDEGAIAEPHMADWIVWDAYLKSAEELGEKRWTEMVFLEIAAHLDPSSGIDKAWRRNASLAWLRVAFASPTEATKVESLTHKVQCALDQAPLRVVVIVQYLSDWGHTSTAYGDVRDYVQQLRQDERQMLLKVLQVDSYDQETFPDTDKLKQAKGVARISNSLKLAYLIDISLSENESDTMRINETGLKTNQSCQTANMEHLTSLALSSLACQIQVKVDGPDIEDLLTTDRHPADDFALLSAMCLTRLAYANTAHHAHDISAPCVAYILQAILLLEYAWTQSSANFQFSILLIRLYTSIGAGSLAKRAFDRLNIKQIQLDTMSHHLYDRISTLHPHMFPKGSDGPAGPKDPNEHFEKQGRLYSKTTKHVSTNLWTAFERGSYNSIFEILEFSDAIACSLAQGNAALEASRLKRIKSGNKSTSSTEPDQTFRLLDKYSDTNDYETFPNLEASGCPTFEQLARHAPAASTLRLRLELMCSKVLELIELAAKPGSKFAAALTDFPRVQLKELLLQLTDQQHPEVTTAESLRIRAYDNIADIVLDNIDPKCWKDAELTKSLERSNAALRVRVEEMINLLKGCSEELPAFWDTLHAFHSSWELADALLTMLQALAKKPSSIHESQVETNKQLLNDVKALQMLIEKTWLAVKARMDESGWIDRIIESVAGQADTREAKVRHLGSKLKELVGEDFLEEWAGDLVESWRDSVGGLTHLRNAQTLAMR